MTETTDLVNPTLWAPLAIPPVLNGQHGTNRARGGNAQIAADNDIDALKAWLARFADTPTTFASYRKEAERLLLWSVIECGKPLSSLTHEDLLVYQGFLTDPKPAERWIMAGRRKPARGDPAWKPFAGPLSAASQRQSMVILNTLFSWLVTAGYLAGSPLALSRQRARHAKPRITRYLAPELWAEVKATVETMGRDTDRERAHYSRVRWLFSLLYLCGLRISEVVENVQGSFFCRRDSHGDERWWLEITGKGQKTRLVPATHELMGELARYRQEFGLVAFPRPGETTPLVLPLNGEPRALTRAALHHVVKAVFHQAADRLRSRGEEFATRADHVAQASAHWLRHTAGSAMADGQLDLRFVRDNLGHASLTTTSVYLHAEEDERHAQTERRHRLGW